MRIEWTAGRDDMLIYLSVYYSTASYKEIQYGSWLLPQLSLPV
ncbi:hypothetical protein DSUL_50289 [Desulfovibrionales bacterium]